MHWYKSEPDGSVTSYYDSDLRDARKLGLYCSITTIEKDIRANPTLANWILRETIKACVEYPKLDWEDIKSYSDRITKASKKIAETAADFGTRLHDALEEYPQIPMDEQVRPYFDMYAVWHEANVLETVSSELMLADDRIGIAGKLDKVLIHKHYGMVICDFKTQNVKAKPSFYSSFARQLAFYSQAYAKKMGCSPPKLLSLVIDSNEPRTPIAHLWSDEDAERAWKEVVYHAWLWSSEKSHWPAGQWETGEVIYAQDVPDETNLMP